MSATLKFTFFHYSWEQRHLADVTTYEVSSLTTDGVCESGNYKVFDANNVIGFTNKKKIEKEYLLNGIYVRETSFGNRYQYDFKQKKNQINPFG